MSKYREFWILYNHAHNIDRVVSIKPNLNSNSLSHISEYMHAIEHQAYTDLKQQADMLYEALIFYADMAINKNHELIFDNENSSRAQVYERYKKYSIGDLGAKAVEATKAYEDYLKESEK